MSSDQFTDFSRAYNIQNFPRAGGSSPGLPSALDLDDVPAHVDFDTLPAAITEETKEIIRLGDHPTSPRGSKNPHFPSRSEAAFRVACDLLRAGVIPKMVQSILLDPQYGISESVREKTNPAQYAERQILKAAEAIADYWLDHDMKGRPRGTYRNALLAMRRLKLTGKYDRFHNRKTINGVMLQVFQGGDLTDMLCAIIRQAIIDTFGFDPGPANVVDAASYLCIENSFHPIVDYLTGLEWDRRARIDTWLVEYMRADDTPYVRAIARIILIAAVRRVMQPGVKFDNIPVFEGPQGSGKSSALQILAGADNFADGDILNTDAKQQMELMEGAWLYELGELAGLNRADLARVKAFASRQVDRARPAYGRFRESRPRETLFIGTTNEDQYLRDQTGNRRFWPVKTGEIDLEGLTRDRDQLWAEAALAEADGESITLAADLWPVAAQEQLARMEDDPWLDKLAGLKGEVHHGVERVTSIDILTRHLAIPVERQKPYQLRQIGPAMRQLGWTGPKKLKIGLQTLRGYERASDAPDNLPDPLF